MRISFMLFLIGILSLAGTEVYSHSHGHDHGHSHGRQEHEKQAQEGEHEHGHSESHGHGHHGEGATWEGVDHSVIEKFAEEAGRSPRRPLINTARGDMLLFVFLIAGAAAGFIAGYHYRKLFGAKQGEK